MKKQQQQEYVHLRLKLAKEKIKSAKILLREGSYRDSISRAYYAIYYAAKALLLYHGQDPYSHKGVSILFHKFCATHKKPDASFAKMLSVLQEARLNADYKEKTQIFKDDAKEAVDMARSFLKEICKLIK
jgi:uncharacterized protein (UPF0332 family)